MQGIDWAGGRLEVHEVRSHMGKTYRGWVLNTPPKTLAHREANQELRGQHTDTGKCFSGCRVHPQVSPKLAGWPWCEARPRCGCTWRLSPDPTPPSSHREPRLPRPSPSCRYVQEERFHREIISPVLRSLCRTWCSGNEGTFQEPHTSRTMRWSCRSHGHGPR